MGGGDEGLRQLGGGKVVGPAEEEGERDGSYDEDGWDEGVELLRGRCRCCGKG